MAIAQPTATDKRNSPSHSALHRIIAADTSAAAESLTVDASGYTHFKLSIVTKTATYTATSSDTFVLCNGTFTVTLPAASTMTGRSLVIKNIGSGTVTIDGNGSETIDGSATQALTVQYEGYSIVSDGSNWHIYA